MGNSQEAIFTGIVDARYSKERKSFREKKKKPSGWMSRVQATFGVVDKNISTQATNDAHKNVQILSYMNYFITCISLLGKMCSLQRLPCLFPPPVSSALN